MISFGLLVALCGLAVSNAAAVGSYYPSIVSYGVAAPASGGYLVPAYLPRYGSYHVAASPTAGSYYNGQQNNQREKTYEPQQDKYYYGGKFQGTCSNDGLYYKDDTTFVICSNGYPSEQPCPPGTKTSGYPSYQAGYYYGYTDLCSVNLVDYGYGPSSYVPSADYAETKESTQTGYKSNAYVNTDSKDYNSYDKQTYSTSRNSASSGDDYQPSLSQSSYPASSGSYASSSQSATVPRDAAGYEIKEAYYPSAYPAAGSSSSSSSSSYTTKNNYPSESRESYSPSSGVSNPYIAKDTAAYSPVNSGSSYSSSDDYVPPKSTSYQSKDYSYQSGYQTKDTVYSPREDYSRVTYPTKGATGYPASPSKRY